MLSLRMKPLSSNGDMGYYYTKDNYYFTGELMTSWFGQGAQNLGLSGPVQKDLLGRVVAGALPNGAVVGKQVNGEIKHRGGYDLTFSAPKSVSILALVGENKHLVDSHNKAVEKALEIIEHEGAEARVSTPQGMTYQKTGNLVFARFVHDTSRALDPALHTHALLMNVTQRADGQWRALSSDKTGRHGTMEWISHNKIYLGMIYRSELASQLVDLGFEIERTGKHGLFEIRHMDQAFLRMMSKRREEIEAQVNNMSSSSLQAFDRATLDTRVGKRDISPEQLMAHWVAQCHALNIDPKTLYDETLRLTRDAKPRGEAKADEFNHTDIKLAMQDAIEHLEEKKLQFSHQEILEKALFFSIGTHTITALQTHLKECVEQGQIIGLDNKHALYTTKKLIDRETSVLDQLEQAKLSPHRAKRPMLAVSREDSITQALAHQDRVVRIKQQGRGDPAFVQHLLDKIEDSGKHARFLTSSFKADGLQPDLKPRTGSFLWRWLINNHKSAQGSTVAGFIDQQKEGHHSPLFRFKKGKDLLVVDDVRRLAPNELSQLLSIAEKREARVLLLEYSSGASYYKSDIRRLLDCANTASWSIASTKNRVQTMSIHQDPNTEKRRSKVVEMYTERLPSEPSSTQIIAHSNDEVSALNQAIRQTLKQRGELSRLEQPIQSLARHYLTSPEKRQAKSYQKGMVVYHQNKKYQVMHVFEKYNRLRIRRSQGDSKEVSARMFSKETSVYHEVSLMVAKGDRLTLRADHKLSGLTKGTTYEVESISAHDIGLKSQGKNYLIPRDKLHHAQIGYDYVSTLYAASSRPKDTVIALIPSHALNKDSIELLVSSAKNRLELITENSHKALARTKKQAPHLTNRDTVTDAVAQRSLKSLSAVAQTPARQLSEDSQLLADHRPSQRKTYEKALDFAVAKLSEGEAAFTHVELMHTALESALGAVRQVDIDVELNKRVATGLLIKSGDYWTTKETLETERTIISSLRAGRGQCAALVSPEESMNALEPSSLTRGQKEACYLITTTRDQFVMVQGYAGTGKTTMLETAIDVIKTTAEISADAKVKIVALAPTHKAVAELNERGVRAQTLKSMLFEQEQTPSFDKNTLLFVDESSMIGNRDFARLTHIIKEQQARAVILGDTAQLQAIESGKPSALALEHNAVEVAYMSEIVRQKNKSIYRAVQAVIDNDTKSALAILNDAIIEASPIKRSSRTQTETSPKQAPSSLDIVEMAAKDYLARDKQTRDNTVVIVASNKDRAYANSVIREGLKQEGSLSQKEIWVSRLIGSNHKPTELYQVQTYGLLKGEYVLKKHNKYYQITRVAVHEQTVYLQDEQGKTSIFIPEKEIKDWGLELFKHEKLAVAQGEKLRFTKSDISRSHVANEPMVVKALSLKQITLSDSRGEIVELSTSKLQDAHWDHRYTVTSYGIQGGSESHVISVLNTEQKRLTNSRSFYIDISRAVSSITIYTDNKNKLMELLNEKSPDKKSAVELIDGKPDAPKESIDKQIQPLKNPLNKRMAPRLDVSQVNLALSLDAANIATNLLGSPNQSLSNNTVLRFGRKGSLAVNLQGEKQGLWYNFEDSEGGNLLQLIQKELGLSFQDALKQASIMTGTTSLPTRPIDKGNAKKEKATRTKSSKTYQYALEIVRGSTPIKGSLAVQYLREHRGIQRLDCNNLRYHPKVNLGASDNKNLNKYAPALLGIAHNENGDIQAVQAIYLDKNTGKKMNVLVQKRTYASIKGAGVVINPGRDSSAISYIAEGIETALSINDSLKGERIICSLGKGNIASISSKLLTSTVVICADNDGSSWEKDRALSKAAETLCSAGKRVLIAMPSQPGDYNSLHNTSGTKAVSLSLNNAVMVNESDVKSSRLTALTSTYNDKINAEIMRESASHSRGEIALSNHPKNNSNIEQPTSVKDKELVIIEREIY